MKSKILSIIGFILAVIGLFVFPYISIISILIGASILYINKDKNEKNVFAYLSLILGVFDIIWTINNSFLTTLIILILMLSLIVFIHEFGHFISAKKNGVYVYEFAIGMGPKLFSFKRKNDETLYSLRLFPLGGYNSLANDNENNKDLKKEQILENKTTLQKFIVLIMGIVFNIVLAMILFFINGLIYGSPINKPYVGEVEIGSPSEEAGLKTGDLIVEVDGVSISNWDDLLLEIKFDKKETTHNFIVERDGEKVSLNIRPNYIENEDGEKEASYGFGQTIKKEKGLVNAFKYSFRTSFESIGGIFKILKRLFTGKIGVSNLSGPIGVYSVVDQIKSQGFETLIYLTAYLSINVGIINLIPIPVFDGGRILLILIEKIINRKLNPKVETTLNNIGALILMILIVYVAINDILKLF